jgi:hypothetical protein
MMRGYRLGTGLLLGILFAAQYAVGNRLTGPARSVAGYVLSLAFLTTVAGFASPGLGRSLARRFRGPLIAVDAIPVPHVLGVASLLLVLDLVSKKLSPYLAVQSRPPATAPLLILVIAWLVVIGLCGLRRMADRICLVGLGVLVLGTHDLVLRAVPFEALWGDMLPNIDRALTALFKGQFPYLESPPPMPYLPVTLLAYAPAKFLGADIRYTNVALDLATASAAMFLAPRAAGRAGSHAASDLGQPCLSPSRVALPLFMLFPWMIFRSVNSQFAPSVLCAVLLGRAITSASPRTQAVMLGIAVASNQMFVVFGPVLVGYWLSRLGWRRAVGLGALSVVPFLAIIAPFLLWRPGQFARVAFLNRPEFPFGALSGRFSLLPLVAKFTPAELSIGRMSVGLSLLLVAIAAACATRVRRPAQVVAIMATTLCAAILVQPASFAHYFLPVMALAAVASGDDAATD